jgi:hypothetical protein
MSAHLSRLRLFQRHLRSLVWVWVWVWDWIHSHTPPRTRSPSSRHPPFTHYPFPLRSLVCGGQPSSHKPRLVVSHSTCPPLSSSPHAHSFVLGTAVINTHTITSPLCQCQMHEDLLQHYDCIDKAAAAQPTQPSGAGGKRCCCCCLLFVLKCRRKPAVSARSLPRQRPRQTRPSAELAVQPPPRGLQAESGFPLSQDQLPTRLPSPIQSQRRITQRLTNHWPQFKALRQHYASTRFEEQRQLHLPQKHKATVPESSLHVEMNTLPCRNKPTSPRPAATRLYWKPLSCS